MRYLSTRSFAQAVVSLLLVLEGASLYVARQHNHLVLEARFLANSQTRQFLPPQKVLRELTQQSLVEADSRLADYRPGIEVVGDVLTIEMAVFDLKYSDQLTDEIEKLINAGISERRRKFFLEILTQLRPPEQLTQEYLTSLASLPNPEGLNIRLMGMSVRKGSWFTPVDAISLFVLVAALIILSAKPRRPVE